MPSRTQNQVRRKLSRSLRGEDAFAAPLPTGLRAANANAEETADSITTVGEVGDHQHSSVPQPPPPPTGTPPPPPSLLTAALDGGGGYEGGGLVNAEQPKSREGQESGGVDGADLRRPVLLNGAMEMLVTALVVLPRGDLVGAMRCVR